VSERHHEDWLSSFVQYAGFGEAPKHMYWWVGVSVIAGALRRRSYIDQYYFRWYPNFYVVLVAPPGVVSKSTTANIGMDLLKRVPGILFGPNVVTWQALVQCLNKAQEEVEVTPGHYETQACLTINSSELGNLLNPQDREMVDMLVSVWDGADIRKVTKGSGTDEVPRPLINLIACTTPSWIASSIPEYMLGGGLLSRCVFVFADRKERFVAYPGLAVPKDISAIADLLVEDLARISALSGEFGMTQEAVDWGQEWYAKLYTHQNGDARLRDYVTRKQTHLHKLAMILSVSRRDDLVITEKELQDAEIALKKNEERMGDVFSQVGKTAEASAAEQIVALLTMNGPTDSTQVYKALHSRFPKEEEIKSIIGGLIRSGQIEAKPVGMKMMLALTDK